MSSIAQYQTYIGQYQVLKSKVQIVVARLGNAFGGLEQTETSMRQGFVVNDRSTAVERHVTHLKQEIGEEMRNLTGTILPAIDAAIAECRRQIAILEEEERQRREAEEAARREAEA